MIYSCVFEARIETHTHTHTEVGERTGLGVRFRQNEIRPSNQCFCNRCKDFMNLQLRVMIILYIVQVLIENTCIDAHTEVGERRLGIPFLRT